MPKHNVQNVIPPQKNGTSSAKSKGKSYSAFLSRFQKIINTLLLASLLAFYHSNLVDQDFTPFERDIFFTLEDKTLKIANPLHEQELIRYRNHEFNLRFLLPEVSHFQVAIRFKQKLYLPIHVFLNSEKVMDSTTSRVKEGLYETVFVVTPEALDSGVNYLQFFGTGLKPEHLEFVTIQNFRGGNKKFPELYITFEHGGDGLWGKFIFKDFLQFSLFSSLIIFGMILCLTLILPLNSSEAFELALDSFLPCLVLLTMIVFSYYIIPYRIHLPELTFFVIAFYLSLIVLIINTYFQYQERVSLYMQGKRRWQLISFIAILLLSVFVLQLL